MHTGRHHHHYDLAVDEHNVTGVDIHVHDYSHDEYLIDAAHDYDNEHPCTADDCPYRQHDDDRSAPTPVTPDNRTGYEHLDDGPHNGID